jgi:peptidoglycan/xylan/chitin deacetylase (PgdA/CDA1 family)/glycosyltransferase involved in cell wall biosynthesis
VDDGSTDDTPGMVQGLSTPFRLRFERQPWSGQSAALNRGIEMAAGRLCLFLDDDITPSPALVQAHVEAQRQQAVVALGRLELTPAGTLDWFARRHAEGWRAHYDRLDRFAAPTWRDAFSGNLSAPRAALLAVGGFDTDLPRSYDIELAYRLQKHGLRIVYVPDAKGAERYDKRLRDVLRDAERAGTAAVALYGRHPAMLPLLELGGRGELGPVGRLARRAVLASRCSLSLLGRVVSSTPGEGRRALWYRFLFSCAYWRGVNAATSPADRYAFERGVTVLMYHAIADHGSRPSRYVTDAGRFRRQMTWLARRRYRVLTQPELVAGMDNHHVPPARAVLITFDDGYDDFLRLAWPILSHHGYSATVFCVTGRSGGVMDWDPGSELAGRRLLDWPQVRRLAESGVAFGAHSRTHARLTDLDAGELVREVQGSRAELERALGAPVATFSYPFGKHDETVRSAARDAGFTLAFGVEPGTNRAAMPPLALRRIEIHGTDSLLRFALTLWLGAGVRRRGAYRPLAAHRWFRRHSSTVTAD